MSTPPTVRLDGGVLVLTEDPALIAAQLRGQGPPAAELIRQPLRDNISTDEIIPGWCCYWYDQRLGDFAYLGLRDRQFEEGAIRAFAPQIIVSGSGKGCGSSREHAVYAEKYTGVQLVFARSFERIYQQNCRNVGMVTCEDFGVLAELIDGAELPLSALTRQATGLERAIIDTGGLFGYNHAFRAGKLTQAAATFGPPRPLNCVEKIVQSHLADRHPRDDGATVTVAETYFVKADVRFSHEYVTPMAAGMFEEQFGADAAVVDPSSTYFFQDHLSLAGEVLAARPNGLQLTRRVDDLARRQAEFAAASGGTLVGAVPTGGSQAICHNYMVERVAEPGQVVIGTDSHTCTAGAVGALAFGIGATDVANAWYTGEILVKVPRVVRIELRGALRPGVCAKDLMLTLLADPLVAEGRSLGAVLLFTGAGRHGLNMDERATVCNMAVEAGAMTAIVEPDDVTAAYLAARPAGRAAPRPPVACDPGAAYAEELTVDLGSVEAMVALPGDPRNAVPLSQAPVGVRVDKIYGGSCTGGKAYDMDMYASVFDLARANGARVPDGVQAYIQMGSDEVLRYATERGYVDLFTAVGVTVLPPSCGACINAGPGVSLTPDEVTVSAQNRNFPGRSGPGQVYLASPYVVAATAIAGRLSSVEDMLTTGGAA
ncbi:aconitase family protein [Catellatospora methionotrophica]|uniref:aconitase family protein n=1 Tax=Catellatospora methionotrophica TaxID=121620 RepID=UPI0033C8E836